MSEVDRAYWDARYRDRGPASSAAPGPPPVFSGYEHLIPGRGSAVELACGRGRGGIWLGSRGLTYFGVDVSPVAIDLATRLAADTGLADQCRFEVHDLDLGLPMGPPADLILVYLFRDRRLDQAIIDRLAPGGVLATACLSEVGAGPGDFRAKPGELKRSFDSLEFLAEGEADGQAWLIGAKPE
ncbi:MAG TPA: methyltransferase domain-containing protein [Acidimicrobiia bacterium]